MCYLLFVSIEKRTSGLITTAVGTPIKHNLPLQYTLYRVMPNAAASSLLPAPKRTLRDKSKPLLANSQEQSLVAEPCPPVRHDVLSTNMVQSTISSDSEVVDDDDDEDLFNLQPKVTLPKRAKDVRVNYPALSTPTLDEPANERLEEASPSSSSFSTETAPKKKRKSEFSDLSTLPLKAVRQADQLNFDEESLKLRLLTEESTASILHTTFKSSTAPTFHKPSQTARATNHITSLAFNSQQQEKSLNAYHAAATASKNETKSKYGF